MRAHRLAAPLAALLVLAAPPARAVDQWSDPAPGVRLLRRSTSAPLVAYALVVNSCAPGVRFRATAPSEGTRTTSSFGRLVGAQFAINGDFADHDFGLNVGNGVRWSTPDTDHSGNISFGANRIEMTPDYVVLPAPAPWVTEQLGGRWTLLRDGVAQRGIDDNGPPAGGFVCAPGLRHPRTAIGLSRDRGTVYLVVADGRSSASAGMTCDELIDLFTDLGAHDAMGLDGGGSSTLWRSGVGLVNRPSDSAGERTVRNHLAVFASGSGAAPQCGRQPVVTEPPMSAAVPNAPRPSVTALTPHSRVTLRTPTRAFDTRDPAGSARLIRGDGSTSGPLSVTSGGLLRADSALGVPADARALWLNLTAVDAPLAGFATLYADGQTRPGTSNLNFVVAEAVANAAPVALGPGGGVRFDVSSRVELIADLSGAFTPTGAGLLPQRPTRVLDSRSPAAPLRAGVTRAVDVRAPAGAVGVIATVTAIARGTPGFLTAHPCGAPAPGTSSVNVTGSAIVANTVASGVGPGGLCLTSSTDLDVVVDVTGALTPDGPLSYVALHPTRVLDTRLDTSPYTHRVAGGQVLSLNLQGLPGMPVNTGAVMVNVTAVDGSAEGFVTVFPCGAEADTSSLNFPAGRAVGALALSTLGGGALCVRSSTRAHLIVDLLGAWAPQPVAPEMDAGAPGMDASTPRDVVTPVDRSLPNDLPLATDRGLPSDLGRSPVDAVTPTDRGAPGDGLAPDVRAPDAAQGDADTTVLDDPPPGCACRTTAAAPTPAGWWMLALSLLRRRRRSLRGSKRCGA